MSALIETVGLKKYFKTSRGMVHAVDDVSISIPEGKTLGVVGESGCGKSTLGRTIVRLYEPTEGSILFKGQDISHMKPNSPVFRNDMQMIFQDPYSSLNPRMTVSQLIAEPLKVTKMITDPKERDYRVFELMNIVGLAPSLVNAYPHELDGGRRQRIGVARALALDPKFIVCDEPVSALDVSIQAQILNLLMDLQDRLGLTYMFITHNLAVVKHISDEILVMYLGQCVEQTTSKELFRNPKHPYTQALLKSIPIAKTGQKRLYSDVIQGELTSPIDPKPGCRFAPRCPYARPECTAKDMEFKEVAPGHRCACLLVQEGKL